VTFIDISRTFSIFLKIHFTNCILAVGN